MKKAVYIIAVSAVFLLLDAFQAGADQAVPNSSAIQPTPQPTAVHPAKAKKAKKPGGKVAKSVSKGADGTSFEKAVVIQAKTEGTGEDEEYSWIAQHYPGYKTDKQSLNENNNHPYDIITITTREGKKMELFFDISNFFGKF